MSSEKGRPKGICCSVPLKFSTSKPQISKGMVSREIHVNIASRVELLVVKGKAKPSNNCLQASSRVLVVLFVITTKLSRFTYTRSMVLVFGTEMCYG